MPLHNAGEKTHLRYQRARSSRPEKGRISDYISRPAGEPLSWLEAAYMETHHAYACNEVSECVYVTVQASAAFSVEARAVASRFFFSQKKSHAIGAAILDYLVHVL